MLKYAIAFDIDGVLLKGNQIIGSVKKILQELNNKSVPYVLVTNGGGKTEKKKAEDVSSLLGINIPKESMILSHTPITYSSLHKNDNILVVGRNYNRMVHIMNNYGFKNIVTCDDFHNHYPNIYPNAIPHNNVENILDNKVHIIKNIKSIVSLTDPIYWGRELQICCDVLRSDGNIKNRVDEQKVTLHNSMFDFEYSYDFMYPRLGSGSFSYALEMIYKRLTEKELKQTLYGKPNLITYKYIENKFPYIDRFFMIGDNPKTDIKGANNASDKWKSILVKTGMYNGEDIIDKNEMPHYICKDVEEAWKYIQDNNS